MSKHITILAACALAVGLAGAAPTASAKGDGAAYHMLLTPQGKAQLGRKQAHPQAGQMLYYGGSVFSAVKVVSVIWGSKVASATVKGIGPYLSALVNSTYVDQFAPQYNTNIKAVNGKQGTNQTIARGTFLGQVQITPKNTSLKLTDKQVRKEIEYQISKGVLPANDLNTLYMIYFPANITINLGGALSCQSFGAYHEAVSAKMVPSNIFYGVMPDCGGGFNFEMVVSSHEFAEATTDNIPTPGSNPKYPQAWNTSDGYEIGDLCEGSYATLTAGSKSYEVQEVFDNNTNACATGNYTSP